MRGDERGKEREGDGVEEAGKRSGIWDILSLALAVFGLWILEMHIVGLRRG